MKEVQYNKLHNNYRTIGILQAGTFLEYFDLMLYVHMAFFLNDLFFPKTDSTATQLLSALTFCSIYVFRPFGALIFGIIGDYFGRKIIIVITTILMAASCVGIAILPTYAQIGKTAAWLLTLFRIIQGISSVGEIVGAQIYLTETFKPPLRYPIVSLIDCAICVGSTMSLAIASLVFFYGINWRIAFWFGALIAIVGSIVRTTITETPEFIIYKTKDHANKLPKKVNLKTSLAYFVIQSGTPLCFYFTYMYCGSILKNNFNYTTEHIIYNNLLIAILGLIAVTFFTVLSRKIHPLRIVNKISTLFLIFTILTPYFFANYINSPFKVFLIQAFISMFGIYGTPANAVFFTYFPISKRFTYSGVLRALSHALVYIVTSYGLVLLVKKFGYYGLWAVMLPISIGFYWGILYFRKKAQEEIYLPY